MFKVLEILGGMQGYGRVRDLNTGAAFVREDDKLAISVLAKLS